MRYILTTLIASLLVTSAKSETMSSSRFNLNECELVLKNFNINVYQDYVAKDGNDIELELSSLIKFLYTEYKVDALFESNKLVLIKLGEESPFDYVERIDLSNIYRVFHFELKNKNGNLVFLVLSYKDSDRVEVYSIGYGISKVNLKDFDLQKRIESFQNAPKESRSYSLHFLSGVNTTSILALGSATAHIVVYIVNLFFTNN